MKASHRKRPRVSISGGPRTRMLRGLAVALLLGLALLLGHPWIAQADNPPPRQREETVTETLYEWWLLPWSDPDHILCRLEVNHPDRPTPQDVYRACGWDTYLKWINTPVCEPALTGGDTSTCEGDYLYLVGSSKVSHTVTHTYPPPSVVFYLEDCTPDFPHFRCAPPVHLRFVGREPMPGAHITAIQIKVVGGDTQECPGDECFLTLEPRAQRERTRYTVRFKATSSWGDATPQYTATVRLVPQGDTVLVDILSPQWADAGVDRCAQAWGVFPPTKDLPPWLSTPAGPSGLATDVPYLYLGGRLIAHGVVDASSCEDEGLLPNGAASPCGIALAQEEVIAWENRFDPQIWQTAQEVGLPATLLKSLLAVESQFWPGEYPEKYEVGFGQLSPHGIDTLLLWEPEVFKPLCEEMLGPWKCFYGYAHLNYERRYVLYQSIWAQANLTCADCPYGVDLSRADQAIGVFAHLVRAHCRQIGQTIHNITSRTPGRVADYADLWRFTLANYNGPDCTYEALRRTQEDHEPLDWSHVREHFPPGCEGPVRYVERLAPALSPPTLP